MRFMKKANNRIWSKAVALLMLCSLVLPMVPTAEAQKLEVKEGKVELYEYRWINSYEELTSNTLFPIGGWVPVMIAWENTNGEKPAQGGWGDGTLWYAKECLNSAGNRTFSPTEEASTLRWWNNPSWDPFKYVADPSWTMPATDDEFILSQEKMGHFYLERRNSYSEKYYSETDDGEKKSPRFRLIMEDTTANPWYFENGVRNMYMGQFKSAPFTYRIGQFDTSSSYEFPGTDQWFEAYQWNVRLFADSDKKNNSDYCWGNVNFHYQSTGSDDHLKHKGSTMYVNDDGAEENGWDRNFRIYTERKIELEAYVEDITVQDGQTFRINKEMYVPDDVTITVEGGGLCIVNARLMLNGQIKVEKGGTIIIEEGATVCPYANESNTAGSIFVDGGNVLVMERAKVISDDTQSKITVNNGGSLINRGLVLARNLSVNTSGRIVNEPAGIMILSMSLLNKREDADKLTAEELYNAAEPELIGSAYLCDGGQLINRGVAKVGGAWAFEDGGKIQNPLYLTTQGKYLCRNEGGGRVEGTIEHCAQGRPQVNTYIDQWPQN